MLNLKKELLGYRDLKIKEGDVNSAVNLLLKLGICTEITADGKVTLAEGEYKRFSANGGEALVERVSEKRGFLAFFERNRFRYGSFSALCITVFLYFFLGQVVWDIRVDGNSELSDARIVSALDECGLSVGSLWSGVDKNEIQTKLLTSLDGISWVSINRRGTVAYVEVMERTGGDVTPEKPSGYSNIVADRDGVVRQINVFSGSAAVKIGDVVQRGQVLISGIVETDAGVSFCHADGVVIAESSASISVFVPQEETLLTERGRELKEVKINIFDFSINIFKKYGKNEESCDIIEEKDNAVILDRIRLPFGVQRIYERSYETVCKKYTKDELTGTAAARMTRSLNSYLIGADLLKIRTEGAFENGGYRMTSHIVYSSEMGEDRTIDIEK